MAGLASAYLTVPPSPDQSQFDWMAFTATLGLPFYSHSFDMNWPGAMWLHELGIRIFGVHAWTWRLTDFLLLVGTTVAGYSFLKHSRWAVAAVLFCVLYPPLYVTAGSWMAGQRDILAAGFLLVACACALPGPSKEKLACVCVGASIACAVLIRPTYLSFLVGILVLEALPLAFWRQRQLRRPLRASAMAVGFLAVFGATILAGFALGNLDDWYQQSIQFSMSIYVGEAPQDWRVTLTSLFIRSWHWITAIGALGLVVWIRRDGLSYPLVLVLGILATITVSFFAQNKYFSYHMAGALLVLTLFCVIACQALIDAQRSASRPVLQRLGMMAILCTGALIFAGTASKVLNLKDDIGSPTLNEIRLQDGYGLTETDRRSIVDMITQNSTPQDTVAVYGTLYDLPYRAKRRSPYRFFTPTSDQINPSFEHHDAWLSEVDTALKDHPPAFVILARRTIGGTPTQPTPRSPDKAILSRLTDHVSAGHTLMFENDTILVYQAIKP